MSGKAKDPRSDRLIVESKSDQRAPAERDRDRILYSSALRRLAGVTQVVAVEEGHVFHNRLTHSMKVAQLGRRLAQYLKKASPKASIDPEVVEAACLAHDLGHPPFGHIGEKALAQSVEKHAPDLDLYEGNAQSFRIVTKLAVKGNNNDGLNLTRATLAAMLKYPWNYVKGDPKKSKKWSAYLSESQEFQFATEKCATDTRSVEASIMDWSDDIAYSIHDLEDFTRAGLIPWTHLRCDPLEVDEIVSAALKEWKVGKPNDAKDRLQTAYNNTINAMPQEVWQPYKGDRAQRGKLRQWTSEQIGTLFKGTKLNSKGTDLDIDSNAADRVRVFKAITRYYVINHPTLAAQQSGQQRLLEGLFSELLRLAMHERGRAAFPARYVHLIPKEEWDEKNIPEIAVRVVADTIASMTEAEAASLHRRLFGAASGSVLDPIFR